MTENNETEEIHEIIFETGLPGFQDERRFALVAWDDSPYASLQSLTDPDLEFVVVPPYVFFPSYEPEIDDATVARLGIETAEEAIVLVMVSINPEDVTKSTANLLGPIVINTRTRQAAQAVLQGSEFDAHTPLVSE